MTGFATVTAGGVTTGVFSPPHPRAIRVANRASASVVKRKREIADLRSIASRATLSGILQNTNGRRIVSRETIRLPFVEKFFTVDISPWNPTPNKSHDSLPTLSLVLGRAA